MAEDSQVSRLEDASSWEDLEKLALGSEEEESLPQEESQEKHEEEPEADTADYLEIDGQRISRDQVLNEYRALKSQAESLGRYTTLLRTLEDRSLHPKWRAAFNALLDPNWESHVTEEDEEVFEEEESEDSEDIFSFTEPKAKPATKAPVVPPEIKEKVESVEARLAEIERAKAERDMIAYIQEFESKYGKLEPDDFRSLEATADRFKVLGAGGWWTPEHGNPIEVIAKLDARVSARLNNNGAATQGSPPQENERQAKQKRMAQQGSSAKGEPQGKGETSAALDELEAALRQSMRYIS